jgi:hypothetical protein
MPVIVVGTEKNFAALRPRLIGGRVSTAAVSEIAAAVRAANPHADLDRLQPGTILTVPDDLPHVSVRGEVSLDDTTRGAIEGLANAGAAALEELVAAARTSESQGRTERKLLAKSLAGNEIDAAARKDKALGADVKATQQAIADEETQAKQRAAALKQAQADWSAELAALKAVAP